MTRTLFATGLVALLFGSGCQSKEEGLIAVCQAPVRCTECASADPASRAASFAQHIASNVSNGDVEEYFAAAANMDQAARLAALDVMLAEEGITDCPMRAVWASEEPVH